MPWARARRAVARRCSRWRVADRVLAGARGDEHRRRCAPCGRTGEAPRRSSRCRAALPLASRCAAKVDYPPVAAGEPLVFPRDHGAHPAFRTEWWYVTGWLGRADALGFQITFFRARPGRAERQPEQLRPAAAPVRARGARRSAARRGCCTTSARRARASRSRSAETTDRRVDRRLVARLEGDALPRAHRGARVRRSTSRSSRAARRCCRATRGFSRKGHRPERGELLLQPAAARTSSARVERRAHGRRARAWLDHEWSSAYLAPEAAGWDWTGINLDDGGALMAFRMRDARTAASHYARAAAVDASTTSLALTLESPRTGVEYPVVDAGRTTSRLEPLMDDQELDARAERRHDLLGRRGARRSSGQPRSGAAISSSPATGNR